MTLNGLDQQPIAEGITAEYTNLGPGTYTIGEDTIPSNYTFDSYSIDEDPATPGAQVTVTSGDTINLTVFNRQQEASITVVKDVQDPDGGEPAYDDGSFTIETSAGSDAVLTDGQSKNYTVNPGTYTFEEIADLVNYDLIDVTGDIDSFAGGIATVTVSSGGSASLTFVNQQHRGSITVVKDVQNPDGGEPAYDDGSFTIETAAPGGNQTLTDGGSYTYDNLNPGTYTFTEAANGDYTLIDVTGDDDDFTGRTATVILSSDEDATITFVNQQHYGSISGHKYEDEDGDLTTTDDRSTVTGWGVQLWRSISGSYTDLAKVDEADTNGSGLYTFSNVIPGYYRIIELVETGWTNLTEFFIDLVIGSGENDTEGNDFVNFENAKITVTKNILDPNGEDVSDPTGGFTVTLNGLDQQPIAEGITAEYTNLGPGTYTIGEDTIPSNYTFDSYSIDEDPATPGAQVTVTSGDTINLTVFNRQQVSTITVIKDVVDPDGGEPAYDDGSFTIETSAGSDAVLADGQSKDYTVNPGTYTFEEIADLVNYDLVNVTGDIDSFTGGIAMVTVSSGGSASLTFVNQQHRGSVTVVKDVQDPDSGEPAYDDGSFTIETAAPGGNQTLTNGGSYTYADLSPGTYTFTEAANGDYTLIDVTGDDDDFTGRTATVILSSDEDATITFVNRQHKATITVVKDVVAPDGSTDVDDNHTFYVNLSGLTGDYQEFAEGSTTTFEVLPGEYNAIEAVDDDYEFAGTNGPITVGSNGSDEITVTNKQKPSSIIVHKTDSSTGKDVAGATYALYVSDGSGGYDLAADAWGVSPVVPDPLVTGDDGIVTFSGLACGTYYVKETAAPGGYYLDTTYHEVVISSSNTSLTIEVTDVKIPPPPPPSPPPDDGDTPTVGVAGIIEVAGITELPFTGMNPFIPISGMAIMIVGVVMTVLSISRRRKWKHAVQYNNGNHMLDNDDFTRS